MARLFQIADLEARKRALVAESEVYRQTLTLEVQNLRLYGARIRRKTRWLSPSNPLLALLGPVAGSALSRSGILTMLRTRLLARFRLLSTALAVWQLYRRFRPILRLVASWRSVAARKAAPASWEEAADLRTTQI